MGSQGSGGMIIHGSVQKSYRCGAERRGSVMSLPVMG